MKKTIQTFVFLFLAVYTLNAQNSMKKSAEQIQSILQLEHVEETYNPVNFSTSQNQFVSFDFASDQINANGNIAVSGLKNKELLHIVYVYSAFHESERFNQNALNIARVNKLFRALPMAQTLNSEKWNVVRQTKAQIRNEAVNLDHGFWITYREKPSEASMKMEVDFLKKELNVSKSFSKEITIAEVIPFSELSDSVYSEREDEFISEGGTYLTTGDLFQYLPDSTVSAVLNRNKHWNKMLVACDLTGSMSPYSAQLFKWHKLNFEKRKMQHFTFFNDGDRTLDRLKKTGNTGGIYHSRPKNFDQLMKSAYQCMRNGFGGDAPENDVEALLEGLSECPDCEEIILIADNWANLRDFELIGSLNKPVRVILCGSYFGANIQYLELARKTGGSIHTMEDDLLNLMAMKEGETIKIGKSKFVIKNGVFKRK